MKISRATILLLFSQAVFLVSGFAVNSGLARLLGPWDYGRFGLVMSILLVVELLVITGLPEVVQKFGGEHPETMGGLVRQTWRWQLAYAGLVFVLFWLGAPLVAGFFADDELISLLRLAGVNIVFYGLYKYFLGVQNGLHRFQHYTWLGLVYALARLAAILGLVWLGFGVKGALAGNVLGSVAALALALALYRAPREHAAAEAVRPPSMGAWVVQNVLYFVGLNLFFSIDLWVVKFHLTGFDVGLYVSAAVLAKLTYFVSIALSAVLLPSLSRAIKQHETVRAQALTQDTLRYLLIFLTLLNVLVFASAQELTRLFFGSAFAAAAPVLRILTLALSCVTLMAVINTVMIAHNMMRACFVLVFALVVVDVLLNVLLVPRHQLLGAATATLLTGLAGVVVAGWHIRLEIMPLLRSWSIPRTLGISACVYVLARGCERLALDFVLTVALPAAAYVVLLWLSREINAVDVRRLREALGSSNS